MSFRTFTTSVLIGTLLCTSFVEARSLRCESLFSDTIQDVIQRLDNESGSRLFNGKDLEEHVDSLSWNRRRKIRKYLQNISVNEIASEKALEFQVLSLGNLLFGRLDIADRWILKSHEERQAQSAEVLARRGLIQNGLLKTWNETYDPQNISRLNRALDVIWRFQNHRLMDLLKFPVFLPTINDQSLSHDLMYKIIRDGFEAHAAEAQVALRQQSKVEAYSVFRRLYTPIFLGIVFNVFYNIAQDEIETKQAAEVAATVEELRQNRNAIVEGVQHSKDMILETAWQRAKADFIAKWGEPPTPEEESAIKAEIKERVFPKKPSETTN